MLHIINKLIVLFLLGLPVLTISSKLLHRTDYYSDDTFGKCADFLQINNLQSYCPGRNDDCYMLNRKSRCYCDSFCSFDCCTDHSSFKEQYRILETTTTTTTTTTTSTTTKAITTSEVKPEFPIEEEPSYFDLIDPCLNSKCENGASCLPMGMMYLCKCLPGFSGINCHIAPEPSKTETTTTITMTAPVATKQKYQHGNGTIGTCKEFLNINNLDTCCAQREDECYMNHHDTRCYCDVFCSLGTNHYDCCHDGAFECKIEPKTSTWTYTTPIPIIVEPLTTTTESTASVSSDAVLPTPIGTECQEKETIKINCNTCICVDGSYKCTNSECMINIELLEAINSNGMGAWKAANHSQFWAKTLEYGYSSKLGTLLETPNLNPISFDENDIEQEAYDFREDSTDVKKLVIRDQGDCGASWAYSTIDVASDRAINSPFIEVSYVENASVHSMIACSTMDNICAPDFVSRAWSFLKIFGATNQKCVPLQDSSYGRISRDLKNHCLSFQGCTEKEASFYPVLKSGPAYIINSMTIGSIMHEIKTHGPVQMVFKVFEDFFMYKSGIYTKHPLARVVDSVNPYHSVKVLGWGSEIVRGKKMNYWIAANSWGENWGENGYFRINRESAETEIGRHVYAAWGNYLHEASAGSF